jgi:hypothetical protein
LAKVGVATLAKRANTRIAVFKIIVESPFAPHPALDVVELFSGMNPVTKREMRSRDAQDGQLSNPEQKEIVSAAALPPIVPAAISSAASGTSSKGTGSSVR